MGGQEDLAANDYLLVETPSMVAKKLISLAFPAASLLYMALTIGIGCLWYGLASNGHYEVWLELLLFQTMSAVAWFAIALYRVVYLAVVHHHYYLNYLSRLFDRQIWTFVWSWANLLIIKRWSYRFTRSVECVTPLTIIVLIWSSRNLIAGLLSQQLSLGFMMNLNYDLTGYLDRLSAMTRLTIYLDQVSPAGPPPSERGSTGRRRTWWQCRPSVLEGDNLSNDERYEMGDGRRSSMAMPPRAIDESGRAERNAVTDFLNPITSNHRNSVLHFWGHSKTSRRPSLRRLEESLPLNQALLSQPNTSPRVQHGTSTEGGVRYLEWYLTPQNIKKTKTSLLRNHMGLSWILDHPPELSIGGRQFFFETRRECRELGLLIMRAALALDKIRKAQGPRDSTVIEIAVDEPLLPEDRNIRQRFNLPPALADYDQQEQFDDNEEVARINTRENLVASESNRAPGTRGDFFNEFLSKQEAAALRSELLPRQDKYGENIHGQRAECIRAENVADAVTRLARQYNDLCVAYDAQGNIQRALYRIITIYLTLVVAFVYLIRSFHTTTTVIAIFGSLATGMSTLMGGGYPDLVQSMMFVLFWNPYRAGDRCRIGSANLLVYPRRICMLHTEFEDSFGRSLYVGNKWLTPHKVANESRASFITVEYKLLVAGGPDCEEKLNNFERALRAYLLRHADKFDNSRTFVYISRALPDEFFELTLYIGFARTGRQWGIVRLDQSALLLKILGLTRKYKIAYRLPVQRFELVNSEEGRAADTGATMPMPNLLSTQPDTWMSDTLKSTYRAPVADIQLGYYTRDADSQKYSLAYPGGI